MRLEESGRVWTVDVNGLECKREQRISSAFLTLITYTNLKRISLTSSLLESDSLSIKVKSFCCLIKCSATPACSAITSPK